MKTTPESFCDFLNGFIEITDTKQPTTEQWRRIVDNLGKVFNKVTPDRQTPINLSPNHGNVTPDNNIKWFDDCDRIRCDMPAIRAFFPQKPINQTSAEQSFIPGGNNIQFNMPCSGGGFTKAEAEKAKFNGGLKPHEHNISC